MNIWSQRIIHMLLACAMIALVMGLAMPRVAFAQDEPPPLTITLPEHVKRRNIPVRPHDLDGYDQLTENAVGDE